MHTKTHISRLTNTGFIFLHYCCFRSFHWTCFCLCGFLKVSCSVWFLFSLSVISSFFLCFAAVNKLWPNPARMEGWKDGQMDGWMAGRSVGCMAGWVHTALNPIAEYHTTISSRPLLFRKYAELFNHFLSAFSTGCTESVENHRKGVCVCVSLYIDDICTRKVCARVCVL